MRTDISTRAPIIMLKLIEVGSLAMSELITSLSERGS
jgi:hypothetical protein